MKIGIFSQVHQSASTWYRALMPFHALQRDLGFEYEMFPEDTKVEHTKLFEYDLGFFLRPHDPTHVSILQTMKLMKKYLWIDYDDDLFSVPFDHKDWEYFQLDTTKRSILDSCELADVVSVTTKQIKQKLVSRGIDQEKIKVIPNAIDDYLYPEPTPHNLSSNHTICWRGGSTHDRDLKTIGPAVSILLKRNFRFIFMGHNPHAIEEYLIGGQYTRIPKQDLFTYYDTLKKINAPYHIVPLYDCELNRAKSNIAFLEASWIGGSIVFTPDWVENAPSLPYEKGSFIDRLQSIDQEKRSELVELSQEFIRQYYLLSTVNEMRKEIYMQLVWGKVEGDGSIEPRES